MYEQFYNVEYADGFNKWGSRFTRAVVLTFKYWILSTRFLLIHVYVMPSSCALWVCGRMGDIIMQEDWYKHIQSQELNLY